MSRKYRHRGYMDYDTGPERNNRSGNRRERREYDGPRGRSASPMFKTFKCERCGGTFPELQHIEPNQKCSNCKADLHCCNNCKFFDPGSRHECMKPIEKPVSRKDVNNDCEFFNAKLTWTHSASPSSLSADEARKVLDNLFKK